MRIATFRVDMGNPNSNLMSVIISGGYSQPTHHSGNSNRTGDIIAGDGQ